MADVSNETVTEEYDSCSENRLILNDFYIWSLIPAVSTNTLRGRPELFTFSLMR